MVKFKVLIVLLIWYGMLAVLFILNGSPLSDRGYSTNIAFAEPEIDTSPSLFDPTGASGAINGASSIFTWLTWRLFLPPDTPAWFTALFSLIQIFMVIATILFIVDALWIGGS